MTSSFSNRMQHTDWIEPHSRAWYEQLAGEYGEYAYPWKSEFDEPTAETMFGQRLEARIGEHTRLLDVGCGHGDFLHRWAGHAMEAVGIDVVEPFIATANRRRLQPSHRFLTVDVNEGLPFEDGYFDMVSSKKGPWLYRKSGGEGRRVIKPGGTVLHLMHGGTDGGLRALFPDLYTPVPPFDKQRSLQHVAKQLELAESGLTDMEIEVVEEVEYLSRPIDVLIKKYFGQSRALREQVWRERLAGVEEVFHKHATARGLQVTNVYYIVTGRVPF
ncbi:hypothetical protein PAESOLCIP111_04352 [Paenibacillus solanacearum]|uniref:Methyltransferase domain-containing protein n=1 Tax=Paenibacillus solanacearum TaxID=2048548 RepID=A0A916K5G1_9BACL|nr:class I SAM-dependent methyltransferase [Paenibacillus solanacearum]CAG7642537.1 hypothetical protein PAESOLCIP111_04352 [Paenibacillus solanacearum]